MRAESRVVMVTGAAGGIGLATALRIARAGDRLVLADVDADGLGAATAAVHDAGAAGVESVLCNVAIESDVASTFDRAMASFGCIDAVVNNAGLMVFKPIEQLQRADVDAVLGVNLVGPLWCIKHAFLRCRPGSAIVNVSSIHALRTSPLVAPYAAAKAGLLALTRSAAIEGKSKGIRVNAVVVGAVDTPMLRNNPNLLSGDEAVDPAMLGQPDQVAAAIDWLASHEASFVNGAALQIDGGRLGTL